MDNLLKIIELLILIYYRTVKGCFSAVFTNAGLNETSHLQHITTITTTTTTLE